ncbi:Whirlin, partial [Geodia barretti]
MTSVRQYEPYAAQLGFLSESIHRQLTERECGIFDRGLADYHRRKNVKAFVECLSLVLNTNQKRQLLIPIRDTYVKPSDTSRFNQLVQAHGLATSLKKKRRELAAESNMTSPDGIHKVEVKRDPGGEWGFNIRGGSDHGTGVFVSWVEPESNCHKSGLLVGDQILKANDTSFESINHHDAVQLIRGCKKLRLWLLSHGRVPSTRMAHKVYRWVDQEGRPTTPPPDPFIIAEQRARGDYRLGIEADERKVTVMVDGGKELGISIRGGSEHGLGVYVSKVDEASVAEAYGIKVGDQIMEVNGVSFLNIVHADAARALRAQPCMVIKVRDVGKLPHSRITTYGQTQWHKGKQREKDKGTRGKKAFQKGAGTQVMLKKYETTGIQSRGLMNEVARSVLTTHELSTFNYYIDQYQERGLSVDDLATALLELLDTPEKLQLLGEVRGAMRASDLDRYNELTIHHEIAAKKAGRKGGFGSVGGSQSRLVSSGLMAGSSQSRITHQTIAEVHQEDPQALQSRLSPPAAADTSFSSGDNTLTLEEDVDFGGRDQVPQRLSPVNRKTPVTGTPVFHAPPPPPTSEPSTRYY